MVALSDYSLSLYFIALLTQDMKKKMPEKVNFGFPVSEGLGCLQVERVHYFCFL
jgi:hypothetical protein